MENQTKHILTCRSCGAQLKEQTLRCPYCDGVDLYMAEVTFMDQMYDMSDDLHAFSGEERDDARSIGVSHAENMDAFSDAYEDARQGVQRRVRGHTRLTGSWILCAALLFLIFALFAVYINRIPIYEKWKETDNRRHLAERNAVIRSCIDAGDFCALISYCDYHRITGRFDDFEIYRLAILESASYTRLTKEVMSYALGEFTPDIGLPGNVERIGGYLHEFYVSAKGDARYDFAGMVPPDPEISAASYDRMKADIDAMLMRYVGFTKEQCEAVVTMTETQTKRLVSEVTGVDID